MKRGNYCFRSYDMENSDLVELSQFYMHCFINPGDHTRGGSAIQSLPKKLRHELRLSERISPVDSGGRAWGIWNVDGPDYTLLSLFAAIGVSVATIVTCVWFGVMDDVQGAMGIGQFLLALVTVIGAATLWNLHST